MESQKRILIVEDDNFLREIYVDTLSEEGFYIETAVDGEEALGKIKKGTWDLVLLDIIMPKFDGLEVIRRLKSDPLFKAPKIIFLTNLDKDEEIQEALKLGDGYFIKSQLNPEEFLGKVKSSLP